LTGTVEGVWDEKPYGIRLECLRQFDAQTWMLAGVLTQSADPSKTAGDWGALIVRDGTPQMAGVWTDFSSIADDCQGFVSGIPGFAVTGRDMIGAMDEGSITLPPAPAASP
jgi:hypothetical protein